MWEGMPRSTTNRYVKEISVEELDRNPNTRQRVPAGSLFRLTIRTENPAWTYRFLLHPEQLEDVEDDLP